MSSLIDHDQTLVTSVKQLADYLAGGCKPVQNWRIGTEHEKFGFINSQNDRDYLFPPAYKPDGIEDVLKNIQDQHESWQPLYDMNNLIGFNGDRGAISLEPAGQFELSGAPVETLHETRREMDLHFQDMHRAADSLALGFSPLGFHPFARRDQMPWMPKKRYEIMKAYMPKVGKLGLDMMTRTCTVQVNLDFSSEKDMARKMRVSLALQPIFTALFANSPFYEGKPSGLQSMRAYIWTDTDNQRAGMPDVFFDDHFGFEHYIEWLLDVPMYFVIRHGKMIDVSGASFRAWIQGRTPAGLEHEKLTMGDFKNHITVAFPDVRLKQYLEMRGADAGSREMMIAMSAFWTGLLYDSSTLLAVEKLVREQEWSVYKALRNKVIGQGLSASIGRENLREFMRRLLQLAQQGLKNRNFKDENGDDETKYLIPLFEIAEGGPTQSEYWLHRYETVWGGDVRRIMKESMI
ncbi:MAG: glutamate--cysteine ligase [Commensalibacter sp.]|nr:glutamate--cysteine ligase [Commensalibacter sp.]MCT6852373.1 glutamate--cysteine ligase [Commensalibacter sp.]MCT6895457.1 glutamate--cysteine ligase [Commensalibacter sp.]